MECLIQKLYMEKKGGKKKAVVLSESEDEFSSEDEIIVGNNADEDEGRRPTTTPGTEQKVQRKENNIVNLHFQQRTTRKCLTIVQGLPDDLDFKKIVRSFKKAWCCNGTTLEHATFGNIIQLQGDHRREISKFLIEEGLASKENIKVHGY